MNGNFRRNILISIVVLSFLVLATHLYVLQVHSFEKYMLLSDKNRIRVAPRLPKRGRVITSDGRVIASNSCRYKLIMDYCDARVFGENMNILSECIRFTEDEKQDLTMARKNARAYHLPIIVKDGLTWEEYAKVAMVFFKLKNVSVESSYIRNYDMPYEFCHVLGYTVCDKNRTCEMTGNTGLELSCNGQLMGTAGNVQMEVNSIGKKVRVIDSLDPVDGKDVKISIDSRLQKYTYDIMLSQKAGACIVLDISTKKILAMVSVPGFDTNMLSYRMTSNQWRSLVNDDLCPLLNRSIACAYPPGSVFKIAVAYAALEEGISPDEKVYCAGSVKLDNHLFHCWNRGGHGYVNLSGALRQSCDCYFFEIAKRLGINKIVAHAKELGYGTTTEIGLPGEISGLLPTKEWKILRYGTTWKPYETMIVGIGQGAMLTTLMQSANMFGKIFSDNKNFRATLLNDSSTQVDDVRPFNARHLSVLRQALHAVCTTGTASGSCNASYGIYGKTGSSQVRSLKEGEAGISNKIAKWKHRDHAFFVGCAPYKNPRYVVAVFVEHGGGGSATAAPIARKIFDKLLVKDNNDIEVAPSVSQ